MGLIRENTYQPPFWLPGGDLQTIYPALFRTVKGVVYRRERLVTSDGDFLLLDWSLSKLRKEARPLAVLSHGFEGDSQRPYITGMVAALNEIGVDCLAWNFRSCGGELNLTPTFYHSGATDDLGAVVTHALGKGYQTVFLIGFSLGGNLTLKYLGEKRDRPKEIAKALCFSVPLDLELCSRHLDLVRNTLYQRRFLASLRPKILEKSKAHPEIVKAALLANIRSVYMFDHLLTAPIHGFEGAQDYYTKCSAKSFVASINTPTLIVNARNDPMVPVRSLPLAELSKLKAVDLLLVSQGGHCGFLQRNDGKYWSELQAQGFFSS